MQFLIDLKKKQLVEMQEFLQEHSKTFTPVDRNTPPTVSTGSSLSEKKSLTAEDLFCLRLGDLQKSASDLLREILKIEEENQGAVDGIRIEEILGAENLLEINECLMAPEKESPKLQAVKRLKRMTGFDLRDCKSIIDKYYASRFRGKSKGELFNF